MIGNMTLRSLPRIANICSQGLRRFVHTEPKLAPSTNVLVDMDTDKGVATLKLNRKPVNSLNLDFLHEICSTVEALEENKSCRGLIITSNTPGVFSAGLDVKEFYKPDVKRLREFWSMVQEIWIQVYGSNMIIMSAINGHSPAGGCLLSLSGDYKVMAEGSYKIGLNETMLGMIAPSWFVQNYKALIGHRETERALQLGTLYPSKVAHQIGMVDALAPLDAVEDMVRKEMDTWLKIPDSARQASKTMSRKDNLNYLLQRRKDDIDFFVNLLTQEAIQKQIGKYLESMKSKASKK